ncbi:MAG: ADP-glyceromanno-heptose 6-epimerase [Elusimicrobia bacterium]|nr:ADP-glyceromanno-heptose 6-epimerase [Elusimicrobiota bacterium]
MKILVTGAAGFIGSNLTKKLEQVYPDASIVAVDDFSSGIKENLKDFKGVVLNGRIENINFLKTLEGPFDVIFHQAAITDTTVTDEERMMDVNVFAFEKLLKLVDPQKTKIVYASSAGVYGNGPVPMKETQVLLPLNAYARSKAKLDEVAMDFAAKTGMTIVGLRYFNVYGPGEPQKGKAASMIYQLARQMIEGHHPRIFKYGEQDRDFIYVKDVVNANLKASNSEASCVVNVGTGVATSFNKIIEILNAVLGTDFKPEYFDNPYDFYQDHTLADTSSAKGKIGFEAKYSIEEGIEDYVRNYLIS